MSVDTSVSVEPETCPHACFSVRERKTISRRTCTTKCLCYFRHPNYPHHPTPPHPPHLQSPPPPEVEEAEVEGAALKQAGRENLEAVVVAVELVVEYR